MKKSKFKIIMIKSDKSFYYKETEASKFFDWQGIDFVIHPAYREPKKYSVTVLNGFTISYLTFSSVKKAQEWAIDFLDKKGKKKVVDCITQGNEWIKEHKEIQG